MKSCEKQGFFALCPDYFTSISILPMIYGKPKDVSRSTSIYKALSAMSIAANSAWGSALQALLVFGMGFICLVGFALSWLIISPLHLHVRSYTLECNYNSGRQSNAVSTATMDSGKASPPHPPSPMAHKYSIADYEQVRINSQFARSGCISHI